jgi:hypothetical protein
MVEVDIFPHNTPSISVAFCLAYFSSL